MRAGVADSLWFFLHCLIDNNAGAGRGIGCTRFVSGRSVFCVACGVCVIFLNTHTPTHTHAAQRGRCSGYCPVGESCAALLCVRPARKKDQKSSALKMLRAPIAICVCFSLFYTHWQRECGPMCTQLHAACVCVYVCECVCVSVRVCVWLSA